MKRKYFGTDGVRGIVPDELSPEFALKLGAAAQNVIGQIGLSCGVGSDTRISSDLIKASLSSGIAAAGGNVFDFGVLPTPGISYLVKHYGLKFGGVVSASHNPYEYNGIKFFDNQGRKLADDKELEIEKVFDEGPKYTNPDKVGRIFLVDEAPEVYSDFLAQHITKKPNIRVAFDCANGATGPTAMLFAKKADLQAEFIFTEPDGKNINKNCGATDPSQLRKFVVEKGLDGGFAFDGDGDRVIVVDEKGEVITGDAIIGFLAEFYLKKGLLNVKTVVGTVMSNYGLEIFLKHKGISFERTPVGDRYVLEKMLETGSVVGGEDSGHIILLDKADTGDGLLVASVLINAISLENMRFSDLRVFEPFPQKLINVKVKNKELLTEEIFNDLISEAEKKLAGSGRAVIRPSGTEPVIRVMIEASEEALAEDVAVRIAEKIKERLGE